MEALVKTFRSKAQEGIGTRLLLSNVSSLKGTMSPQAHAGVGEKHRQRVQKVVFICLNRVYLRKVS